ncbi:MAG: hypothetical protein SFV15_09230 [Polyangiaceae bacterium]|nr:hypothetical protein [Polyangiaceae bacterium]
MTDLATVVRRLVGGVLVAGAILGVEAPLFASENVALFESGQVRPLALSPSGNLLFAVNTPDARLEIFRVLPTGLSKVDSVAVGLEPVAVAARNENEVWVVNHLSDSVSIVDLRGPKARVVRTLQVGDEPRDIVFGGQRKDRAFITVAHRGQNAPFDPQFNTPGVGRADVWVYDADNLGSALTGNPINIINLFTDTPRALEVSPDGGLVYAAGFNTGNRTTIVTEFIGPPLPPPTTNFEGLHQPKVGLIVKNNGQNWVDELGRPWDALVNFNLPDKDVFVIDAFANPPQPVEGGAGYFQGVGTVLYNMAVNPVSGKVYVSNTDARNEERFEGPGVFAGHSVQGRHNDNRITVLGVGGAVQPRHLNKHLDNISCCASLPNAENAKSVGLPTGMVVSADGSELYVASLGSSVVATYKTSELEQDTFVPSAANKIALTGGGATGLVFDKQQRRLFVMTRFDNSISVVDTRLRREVAHTPMYTPEPPSIVKGRHILYDTRLSAKGDSACATCHVFGDKDDLSWDLGDPDGTMLVNNNPFRFDLLPTPIDVSFPPMKGPLATQSLRGMANHGPMHWRGDRTGSRTEPNAQPDSGAYNEREAFRQFEVAFTGLIGRADLLPPEDMQAFGDFALRLMYPPNPIRNLDNSLTPDQAAGREFFFHRKSEKRPIDGQSVECNHCHQTDPDANREFGVAFPGFFGTDGQSAREVFDQAFKIPHFRNLYTKVGMFGMPNLAPLVEPVEGLMTFQGDQVRGFGYSRAGDFDTALRFLHVTTFSKAFLFGPNPDGFDPGPAGLAERLQVQAFLLAFDSNNKPIVGQQITLTRDSAAVAWARAQLLAARADAGDCDLVAKVQRGGSERGYLYLGGNQFLSDQGSATVPGTQVFGQAALPQTSVTLTCAPLGTGFRSAVDRDDDGILDGNDPTLN